MTPARDAKKRCGTSSLLEWVRGNVTAARQRGVNREIPQTVFRSRPREKKMLGADCSMVVAEGRANYGAFCETGVIS